MTNVESVALCSVGIALLVVTRCWLFVLESRRLQKSAFEESRKHVAEMLALTRETDKMTLKLLDHLAEKYPDDEVVQSSKRCIATILEHRLG